MSENDPERDLVEETARWHVQLKKAFSCTICLDFRINSVSTKCQHSFCGKCIEGWIETKGTRGRAKCPVCLAGNLTKRSLNSQEEVMGRQIALVKKFFEVEREEMNGELDFLTLKVVNKVLFRTFPESIYSVIMFRMQERLSQVPVNRLLPLFQEEKEEFGTRRRK